MEHEYDIALSFAGENRVYVEAVAANLKEAGVSVFYDNFFDTDLWGKDLYQYLNDLYKNKALYTVLFISKEYKDKLWTRHELKSAQARAFLENDEYILPVRFDNTDLPGVNSTTGYLDISSMTPVELSLKIQKKLISSDYFDKTKLTNPIFDSIQISDGWNESTKFFHFEFGRAFPEIFESTRYTDKKEIQHRLAVLLNNPRASGSSETAHDPIWVFRGHSGLPVFRYKIIDNNSCLLNNEELNISELFVFKSGAYWQDFIYVMLNPSEQTGVNNLSDESIKKQIEYSGYAYEVYGLYRNRYISSTEVENGHYVADGKVHPITGKAEIRTRYLSKYSFFIAPKASPLNIHNHEAQKAIEKFCTDNVNGKVSMDSFIEFYNRIERIDQRY